MKAAGALETKRGQCPVCGTGCHVEVRVESGIPVKVKADSKSPNPAICPRAGQALTYHNHPDRLNFPLKHIGNRGEGRWQRISWEQALDEIAAQLGGIRDQYGPEAVSMLGGSVKGAADAAAWRWCNLWGTPNYMHQGKNCGEPEFLAEWAIYGSVYQYGMMPQPGLTKCGIAWGANPPPSWGRTPYKQLLDAVKQGMKLIVIDPRRTETAEQAHLWIRLRPGTDGALAYGMLNVIINEGLYDREFVERWCLGFEELKARVQPYTPATVSAITWVPEAQIVEAARLYATLKPGWLSYGLGAFEGGKGTMSAVFGKAYLRALTGNLDVQGGQHFDDPPEFSAYREELHWDQLINHPLRTRDNVSAHQWPIASMRSLQLYREAMGRLHPKGVGPATYMIYPAPSAVWTAILEEQPYPIKAMITQGTNTLVAFANSKRVYQALKSEKLALHVAMDHWMTPTAQLADYVLPASDGMERPGLTGMWGFGNIYGGAVRVVNPQHERRDDYQLWRELGNRLGQQGYWPDTLEGWFDQLLKPSKLTFSELTARELPWLFPEPRYKRYETEGFATSSGKVELAPTLFARLGYNPMPDYEEPGWSPVRTPELAQEYPLVLTTGGSSAFYYRSQHKQLQEMRKQQPYAVLQINPETAAQLAIADGDFVYVETPLGRVRQQARLSQWLHPKVVNAEQGWWYPEQQPEEPTLSGVWESNINVLIPDGPEHADFAGDNHFRGLLCRVSRAAQ